MSYLQIIIVTILCGLAIYRSYRAGHANGIAEGITWAIEQNQKNSKWADEN